MTETVRVPRASLPGRSDPEIGLIFDLESSEWRGVRTYRVCKLGRVTVTAERIGDAPTVGASDQRDADGTQDPTEGTSHAE